jgi:hypothetical protein
MPAASATNFSAKTCTDYEHHPATQLVDAARAELRGKNLACWCKLPAPYEDDECHAAVLLKIANETE